MDAELDPAKRAASGLGAACGPSSPASAGCGRPAAPSEAVRDALDAGPSCPFDRIAALDRMDGDLDLLTTAMEAFVDSASELLRRVEEAADAEDCDRVRIAAHSVKGVAATLEARALTAEARRLELLGNDGDLAGVREAIPDFQRELAVVVEALQASLAR